MDDTVIVIRYNGMFVMNEVEGNWEYLNGRNKARLIKTQCTHKELQEIVYDVTKIDRNNFQIIMKYIFHSSYKLDPIEIENDGDVQCFIKEQFRVDATHRSPLYIEVSPRVVHTTEQNKSVSRDNVFVSGSGSNHCSSTFPAINVFSTPISRPANEIPTISRRGCGSSPVNLGDDNLNNVNNAGVDVEDELEDEGIQQFANIPDDYGQTHDGAGVDVDINTALDMEIESHTEDTETDDGPHIGLNTEAACGSLPVDEHIQITRQVPTYSNHISGANTNSSSSTIEPSTTSLSTSSTSNAIEVGEVFGSKKELQLKLSRYTMKMHYEFKVHKSCTQRFEVKCVDDTCPWQLRASRINGLEFFSVKKFYNVHECSKVKNLTRQNRQATSGLVGDDIMPKYDGIARVYRPMKIVFDIEKEYGVRISYDKA